MQNKQTIGPKVVCFKRWTRKSYAVFSSLKLNVRIGVLSLSCSILALPGYCQQKSDSIHASTYDHEIVLDDVVVTAQQASVVQSQLMRVVHVITRSEIEQAPGNDLGSLLEHVRGVDIRQRGAFGMQADISLRGGTFDQTLILLNGVNLTDPQTGHHNLNLPVDLSSIQRIEVLQGPGARVFGPNAFNGVINIITGERTDSKIQASLQGGQYGTAGASVAGSLNTKKSFHHFAMSGVRSDGFTRNTDFKNGNLYYRGIYPVSDHSFDLQAGYTLREFGANSFYTPKYPDQFEETSSRFVSLKFLTSSKIKIQPLIYWRRHNDRFELFRKEAPGWYTGHNYHLTDVAGGSLKWMTVGERFKTSVVMDYRFEHIYSNVLGLVMQQSKPVKGHEAEYTKSYQRESLSLMAEQVIIIEPFTVSAGLMVHKSKTLDSGISLYPGVDIGWQKNRYHRWYATFNRTLRQPTFTDLFYNGPTNVGNPDLKSEEAVSIETGLKSKYEIITADFAVYRRYGSNMIDWVKFPGDEKWRSLNLTKVNISGLEAGLDFHWWGENEATFIRYTGIQYTLLHADKSSDGFVSLYVLDYLKHKIDFKIGNKITSKSGIDWKASYQDRVGGYLPFADNEFVEEQSYKPILKVDMRIFYNFNHLQLYMEASNLFDVNIIDHSNVPLPGRWIMAGVKFSSE